MRKSAPAYVLMGAFVILLFTCTTAFAASYSLERNFGSGLLAGPLGAAVDQSSGNVYVTDSGHHRVTEFDATGDFILTFGSNVNLTAVEAGGTEEERDVCTAASGDVCQEGVAGGGVGQFNMPWGAAVDNSGGAANGHIYVADFEEGAVDVYDSPSTPDAVTPKITESDIPPGDLGAAGTGEPFGPIGVAVDQANGDVYVADEHNSVIDVFNPANGYEFVEQMSADIATPFGLAVNSANGHVYSANVGGATVELGPNGEFIKELTAGGSFAVAVAAGRVYVTKQTSIEEYDAANGEHLQTFGSGQLVNVLGLAVNGTTGSVYGPDDSENFVNIFESVVATGATSNVQSAGGTLHGTIEPVGGASTEYDFEYGTDTTYGKSTPLATVSGAETTVEAQISGLLPNTVYHYRLTAQNGAYHGEDMTFTTSQPKALVAVESAADAERTRVLLSGAIEPENGNARYSFEYGKTTAYGSATPTREIGATLASVPIGPEIIEELTAGTTYHYRLVVNNAAGTTFGEDQEFTTTAPRLPQVNSGAASEVTATTAEIRGAVNPDGLSTIYVFEIGTGSGYETQMFGEVGAGSEESPVQVSLQSLAPGVTYHYRIVAINHDGTTAGPDVAFATAGVANPIVAPQTPVLVPIPQIAAELVCAKGFVESNGKCVKQQQPPVKCKKGDVKKNGKCVKPRKKPRTKAKGGKKKG
jgi:DNA-binding beta-propeller fold protein YncE